MQRSKKHIFGAIGLVSVAAMTTVAYNIPAPAAYADESTTVPLTVNVTTTDVDSEIGGDIQDGTRVAKSEVTIPLVFYHSETLVYRLTVSQDTASASGLNAQATETVIVTDPEWTSVDASTIAGAVDQGDGYAGTYNLDLDLGEIVDNAGFSRYKLSTFELQIKSYGRFSGVSTGDAISFTYGQVAIDVDTNIDPDAGEGETNVPTDDNGDPIITIDASELASRLHTVVTNEAGEVVLEGDITPDASGVNKVTLAFAEKGLPTGYYTITVYAYDDSGTLAGTSSLTFYYVRPASAGLPNTGGSIFAGLNIGRADFLASGLLIFGLTAVFGLVLISRSKKSRR